MEYQYCRIAKSCVHGEEVHPFISEMSMVKVLKKVAAQLALPIHLRSFKPGERIIFRVVDGNAVVLSADVINFGN